MLYYVYFGPVLYEFVFAQTERLHANDLPSFETDARRERVDVPVFVYS